MGINAGAGAAAAVVGARGNSREVTTLVVQMGALAGFTKALIATSAELLGMVKVHIAVRLSMILITSSFGICPLLVTEVCSIVLGESKSHYSCLESVNRQTQEQGGSN